MGTLEIVLVIVALLVVVGGFAYVSSRSTNRSEPIEPSGDPGRSGVATLDRTAPEKASPDDTALDDSAVDEQIREEAAGVEEAAPASFRDRLTRAKSSISGALASITNRGGIDDATWDELEEALLLADVGIGPTTELLDAVRERVRDEKLTETDDLVAALKAETTQRLLAPIDLRTAAEGPSIYLFVGVNGVGKTTTIGKIGKRLTDDGASVVMAAGDTFRAAAAEQLQAWAERGDAELIRGDEGGDPSAVIFDAVAHASATDVDYVLADTAGRLHNKSNLMSELSKVRRVADKGDGEVAEVLLVLDATTGQNGLAQARVFTEAVDVTGVVLTKLDGSAKGGIVLAIHGELGIPVKLVGLGEGVDDLIPFDAEQFSDALFSQ